MRASVTAIQEDRQWYYLALRHLRMATRLLRDGFTDGAVFHAYHAYECLLSAFISTNGYPVPPAGKTSLRLPSGKTVKAYPSPHGAIPDLNAHKARIVFFEQLADRTNDYYTTHTVLRTFMTYQDRLDSLYFDPVSHRLPHQRYQSALVRDLLQILVRFAREVRVVLP